MNGLKGVLTVLIKSQVKFFPFFQNVLWVGKDSPIPVQKGVEGVLSLSAFFQIKKIFRGVFAIQSPDGFGSENDLPVPVYNRRFLYTIVSDYDLVLPYVALICVGYSWRIWW